MSYAWFNSTDFTPTGYIDWAVGIEPMLFPLILFAIFVIATITGLIASGGRFGKAVIFSSFLSFILSITFVIMGWMSKIYVGLTILMFAFAIFVNQLIDSRE